MEERRKKHAYDTEELTAAKQVVVSVAKQCISEIKQVMEKDWKRIEKEIEKRMPAASSLDDSSNLTSSPDSSNLTNVLGKLCRFGIRQIAFDSSDDSDSPNVTYFNRHTLSIHCIF